jgi:hypothetical protein
MARPTPHAPFPDRCARGTDAIVPTTVELLEQLLRCAETRADASAILHERVVLERLDGEVLRGRATVVDAMVTRESGSALKVIEREDHEALRVALVIEGIAGHIPFVLRGFSQDGVLLAIVMEG